MTSDRSGTLDTVTAETADGATQDRPRSTRPFGLQNRCARAVLGGRVRFPSASAKTLRRTRPTRSPISPAGPLPAYTSSAALQKSATTDALCCHSLEKRDLCNTKLQLARSGPPVSESGPSRKKCRPGDKALAPGPQIGP
jgi:hypothetical protein